jgi:hypothetical protein
VKLTPRDTMLLAVITVIVLAGGLWYLLVRPASSDLSAARDELVAVREESTGLRDTLGRLSGQDVARALDASERLETAKALPEETAAPGMIVELERLAKRANVELDAVRTLSSSAYGGLVGTEYEVVVSGAFFDADDFLYRMHRLVEVNERRVPSIRGRLYAMRSINLESEQTEGEEPAPMDEGRVTAKIDLLVFSSGGAVEGTVAAPTTTPTADEGDAPEGDEAESGAPTTPAGAPASGGAATP